MGRNLPDGSGLLHSRIFPPDTEWAPQRPPGSTSRACRPCRQFGWLAPGTCPKHMSSTPAAWTRCRRFRERSREVASTSLGRTSHDRSRGTLCPTWPTDLGCWRARFCCMRRPSKRCCTSRQGTLFPPQIPQDRRCRLGTAPDRPSSCRSSSQPGSYLRSLAPPGTSPHSCCRT